MGLRSWILKPYLEKIYNLEDEVKDLKENSHVGAEEALEPLKKLLNNTSEVRIETTVGKVAEGVIRKIEARKEGISKSPRGG